MHDGKKDSDLEGKEEIPNSMAEEEKNKAGMTGFFSAKTLYDLPDNVQNRSPVRPNGSHCTVEKCRFRLQLGWR